MSLDEKKIGEFKNLSDREILILTCYKVNVLKEQVDEFQQGHIRHEAFINQLKEKAKFAAVLWGAIASAVVSGIFALISSF